ncbi:type 1 glutamine amidotransferase domain-containing protein [Sphingomonas solaris]|uniref:Type 1 glutamine amidotransferase n=1 Tax=Alterirhizorhabdus solaris TaxID=2529389 RepID=A0A558QY99_9SPHN|nr:type 1 glutamine amidotransferase domain-containing protein [Sphingomonas solaris]TVV72111.1 type 1 glutamine amidotransferase [Sphingomonas solaris]
MPAIADAHVLIIATNRFEESELFDPRETLLARGAKVTLASIDTDPILATVHDEPGRTITPDITLGQVNPDDYDALLIPGGVGNPDTLRTETKAIEIVRAFDAAGKPVAAICHGPWMLAEAGVVSGRTVSPWPSIRTDLKNAGATIVDQEVAVDGHLITSRKPDDIPAFTKALIAAIEGR